MELPFDILLEIALASPAAWLSMLALPAIGRWGRTRTDFLIAHFIKRVEEDKTVKWLLPNGMLHSIGDRPAFVRRNEQKWYRMGQLHRDVGPAVSTKYEKLWYKNGKCHREGAPAYITNANLMWYRNGVMHRDAGPAWCTAYGTVMWYYDGIEIGHTDFPMSHEDFITEEELMKLEIDNPEEFLQTITDLADWAREEAEEQ